MYKGMNKNQWQMDFITKSKEKHNGKYNYREVNYINMHTKVMIICPDHGAFLKTPEKHLHGGKGCPTCSKIQKLYNASRFKTFEDVVICAKEIHKSLYEYVEVYSPSLLYGKIITTNSKLVINCSTHGYFTQTINKHIYQKTGCSKCFHIRNGQLKTKTTEAFIKDSIKIHGKRYDYTNTQYKAAHSKVKITCPEHGPFEITPANHTLHSEGCNVCYMSSPEIIIRQFLLDNNIIFEPQKKFEGCVSPYTNAPLRFDFYIPYQNLLIEYDGIYHFEPIDHGYGREEALRFLKQQQTYDFIKNEFAREHKIQLLRIHHKRIKELGTILVNNILMSNTNS